MKKALLVGINDYPFFPLRGCINDVEDMAAFLVARGGFRKSDIRLVTDRRATASAITSRLRWLVRSLRPGDEGLFHFSGHGTRLATRNPEGEVDGLDEVVCPADYDWTGRRAIRDKDFAALFQPLRAGARLLWISDSCHSGDLSRGEDPGSAASRPRRLPAPPDVAWRIAAAAESGWRPLGFARVASDLGLNLLAACAPHETAIDGSFDGRPNGAFTRILLDTLASGQWRRRAIASLVAEVGLRLAAAGFTQTPGIEGSERGMRAPFVRPEGRRVATGTAERNPPAGEGFKEAERDAQTGVTS